MQSSPIHDNKTLSRLVSNHDEWIGRRVAKYFGERLYFGFVTHSSGNDLWEVCYDDGDKEDLDQAQLETGAAEFERNEHKDPQVKYLGRRVARLFDDDQLYFGTVSEFIPAHETGERVWYSITYDDGDGEDVHVTHLRKLITLYNKNADQDPKKETPDDDDADFAPLDESQDHVSKDSSGPTRNTLSNDEKEIDGEEVEAQATVASRVSPFPARSATTDSSSGPPSSEQDQSTLSNHSIVQAPSGVSRSATASTKKPKSTEAIAPSRVSPSPLVARSAFAANNSNSAMVTSFRRPTVTTPATASTANNNSVMPMFGRPPVATPVAASAFAYRNSSAMMPMFRRPAVATPAGAFAYRNSSAMAPMFHRPPVAVGSMGQPVTDPACLNPTLLEQQQQQHEPTFTDTTHHEETTGEDITTEEVDAILAREEKVDWKQTQKELDDMFEKQSKQKMAGIPEIPMPPQFGNLTLFDYQRQGIQFLAHQETRTDATPPFYKLRRFGRIERWWCGILRKSQLSKPQPIRGSILADDMGLGKTLQTIGLILSNPPQGYSYPIQTKSISVPRCTIVVCPLSVISNWQIQIDQFVNNWQQEGLKVATYHGPNRARVLERIDEIDVLLTTYNTLAWDLKHWEKLMEQATEEETEATDGNEIRDEGEELLSSQNTDNDDLEWRRPEKKRRKTEPSLVIFNLQFHRIVLDEAHIIRNSDTGVFKAVSKLEGVYKLALTGTPFVNRPSDIHALLSFLGVEPLNEKSVFMNAVVRPIMQKHEIGLSRIRVAMSHVALRRSKAQVDSTLDLVEKTVEICHVEFPQDGSHMPIHDLLYDVAREAFIGLLREGTKAVFRNYFHIMALILRIRMSCCHGALVPEDFLSRMRLAHGEICELHKRNSGKSIDISAKDGEEILFRILEILRGDAGAESKECAVCFDEMEGTTCVALRTCKHIFCEDCLVKVENSRCPFCRVPFTPADMIKKDVAEQAANQPTAIVESKIGVEAGKFEEMELAPKIEFMLDIIAQMAPDEKGVIFSQWTSCLDCLSAALEKEGHTFTRIDGTKKPQERLDAIKAFSTDATDSMDTPRFMLVSLHAAGTGINLTRGNVVICFDPWWNNAIENQAIDRVHRIGQTRPVRAYRLIMKGTLEERMVDIQNCKAALGKGSMQKLTAEERKKAKITALKDLFEVTEEEENWQGVYDDTYEADTLWEPN